MEEKYFVLSDGDAPDRIAFSIEEATEECPTFIDIFDEAGNKVRALMRTMDGDYTENF